MEFRRLGMVAGALIVLSGCATQRNMPVTAGLEDFNPRISCQARVAPEEQVELEMVDTLVSRNRHYAALAQLQNNTQRNPQYWMRYGQLLAQTGDLQRAALVFETMKDRCDSGESHHGLGMVALKQNDLNKALRHFELAVNKLPASSQVRNDYGYALLLDRSYETAARHLRTALELHNGQGTARQNLAVSYLLSNNQEGLAMLKHQYHFNGDELEHARGLASQLRRE